jgi:hypothetical protein
MTTETEVNKAAVMEAAKRLANAQAVVEGLGMTNRSLDPDKRLEQAVQYRVAKDLLEKAQNEYRDAFED